ncbi:MAG: outer membrane lipoprotein chaperone LolA [Deltaproteobacteria bacterium]|nr:outer membrane lipoprotein chaperone LolA [Deltaproteobacteria bacterium]
MWIPFSPLVTLALHLLVPADTPATGPAAAAPAAAAPTAAAPTATAPTAAAPALPPPAADARLDAVVDAIQKTYDATTDFSGSFTQRYTYTLLRRTEESKGEVKFKKPGLMRWDYQQPKKKSFVVDGKSLWLHSQEDNTAFVNACFKNDGLTASVAFLWGQGKIREQFDVAWFAGTFGDKSDHHLELTPKQGNAIFAKLIIVVDPKTSRVKQSIVVDPSGNVNQFSYSNLKFNKALPDTAFTFTPPSGAHVARLPGSCDAPVPGLK